MCVLFGFVLFSGLDTAWVNCLWLVLICLVVLCDVGSISSRFVVVLRVRLMCVGIN